MARHLNEERTDLRTISQASPIERFFRSYPNLQYNPSRSSAVEFQLLRKLYGWQRGDSDGERAWSGFRLALVKEFNRLFGTDPNDLLAWQTICMVVGIQDRLTTRDDCVQSLQSRHFNIVDLIDARRRGEGVAQAFPTEESLQEYTKTTASYFPYYCTKAGQLLRHLLRKPRNNTIGNVMESPLFPPPNLREGRHGDKDKGRPIPSSKREGRPAKKARMIAESVEADDIYSYVKFESESAA